MSEIWWDFKQVMGRLRLRLVRKRGMHTIQEALTQPDFQAQVEEAFAKANEAPSRTRALEDLSDWFVSQSTQSNAPRVFRELWIELRPLLDEMAHSPSRSQSRVSRSAISHSRASRAGLPTTATGSASQTIPKASSSDSHRRPSMPSAAAPERRSTQSISSLRQGSQPSVSSAPAASQVSPSSNNVDRLRRLRANRPSAPSTSASQTTSAYRPSTPSTPRSKSISSLDNLAPHETVETTKSFDGMRVISKSSPSNVWLPSTSTMNEATSDSLDDLAFETWWETQSVIDSLKFRLSRRTDATQLNLLLGHDEFVQILSEALDAGAVSRTIHEAQEAVLYRMKKLQALTPENNWFKAFWQVLRPILQLRHRYSASFDSLPAPMAEQLASASQSSIPAAPKEKEGGVYDWENNNKEWVGFINKVVGQIAHFEEDGEAK